MEIIKLEIMIKKTIQKRNNGILYHYSYWSLLQLQKIEQIMQSLYKGFTKLMQCLTKLKKKKKSCF